MSNEALRYTTRRQMTVAKTFSRQNEVPRLPLPSLENTISKYIKTIEPYGTFEEIEATKKAALEFLNDPEVKRRQECLIKLKDQEISWLERMWLDIGYHQWRAPLPINSNVTGYLIGKYRKKWPQAWSAAGLTIGAVNYYLQLKDGSIPVNMAKDKPQCMDQYSRMFGLNRVPGEAQDRFEQYFDSKHIVIVVGRRSFKITVLNDENKVIPFETLMNQIETLMKDAKLRGKI